MTLAAELSTLKALAVKRVEKETGAYVQNGFGNMLSFVCRTEPADFGWKATAPFLSFQLRGLYLPPYFFFIPRTFVIEHSTKVLGQRLL